MLENVNPRKIKKRQIVELEKYTKRISKQHIIEFNTSIFNYLCEWVLSIKEYAYRNIIMNKVKPLLIKSKLEKQKYKFPKHYDAVKFLKIDQFSKKPRNAKSSFSQERAPPTP